MNTTHSIECRPSGMVLRTAEHGFSLCLILPLLEFSPTSLEIQSLATCFITPPPPQLCFMNCSAGEDSWECLGQQVIKPVHPKGNQSWIFIGRTDADAEALILWPPDAMKRLIGKDPDAGKDWRQEEKGTTEDEMVGWHHRLDACEFEQSLRDGDGQRSLVSCSPQGCKESDTT